MTPDHRRSIDDALANHPEARFDVCGQPAPLTE
jgi:hypothetical protein